MQLLAINQGIASADAPEGWTRSGNYWYNDVTEEVPEGRVLEEGQVMATIEYGVEI